MTRQELVEKIARAIAEMEGFYLTAAQAKARRIAHPTLAQINDFFTSNGWKRFTVGGEVAYFDPERQVAISDTHRGNIIMMEDGLLAPIDLRVQRIHGALLDFVIKACRD